MKKSLIVAALLPLAFFACKGEGWGEVERLQAQVEAIHDEPMKRMDELDAIRKKAIAALLAIDSTDAQLKSRRDSLASLAKDCQKANELMFDWMAAYRAPDRARDKKQAALDYLNLQKIEAQKMSDAVLGSIERGNALLKK